jgi:diguanylate cyclase (GGDEF)-like protein
MSTNRGAKPKPAERHGVMRVVLLGRTGLDAALRDDAAVELVRARTPLEAVGEVASPPAAAQGVPTVVVVGQGAEPETHHAAFLAAMREANPAVRLVRVGSAGPDGASYDAVLNPGSTPEALRAAIGDASAPRAQPGDGDTGPAQIELPPEAPEEPTVVVARAAPPSPRSAPITVGDAAMLGELANGSAALLRAGLALIRERAGIGDLSFVELDGASDPGLPTDMFAWVAQGSKRYGLLRTTSTRSVADRLRAHADWLAAWLAAQERQQSLRKAAFTDPLTGAWNRRYFDGFLTSAIDRARATRRTVTVLVFDIDGFKQYNDRFGHLAGDEILIETVRALKTSVRPSDRVCRIGGDEFAVIFDDPQGPRQSGSRPPESVYVLAKRVQRQIAERRFPKLGADAPGVLTISGGLAAFPWDGHDAETLLCKADDLACQSKRQGKNAITLGPGAERLCRGTDDPDC